MCSCPVSESTSGTPHLCSSRRETERQPEDVSRGHGDGKTKADSSRIGMQDSVCLTGPRRQEWSSGRAWRFHRGRTDQQKMFWSGATFFSGAFICTHVEGSLSYSGNHQHAQPCTQADERRRRSKAFGVQRDNWAILVLRTCLCTEPCRRFSRRWTRFPD